MKVQKLIEILQQVENQDAVVRIAARNPAGGVLAYGILDVEDWSLEDENVGVLILPRSK